MSNKYITFGAILCGALAGGFLITYFASFTDRVLFGGVGFLVVFIVALITGERIRRVIEGYYVYMKGGAEDGSVFYNEAGQTIQLYFSRRKRIIYVPAETKWHEVMPAWAKGKKNFITDRIRKQTGRHWSFEETEKREHVMSQTD